MRDVLDFFAYSVPWWVWGLPVPAAALALYLFLSRSFGFRSAIMATGAFLSAFLVLASYQRGRQKGWNDRRAKEERDAKALVEKVKRARDAANARNADGRFLRDDDGYKRKS